MDFLSYHPEARLQYFAGNMQLVVDSDIAYLVSPGAKSRYTGTSILDLT